MTRSVVDEELSAEPREEGEEEDGGDGRRHEQGVVLPVGAEDGRGRLVKPPDFFAGHARSDYSSLFIRCFLFPLQSLI